MSDGLSIPHYHKWFKDMVESWIRMAIDKCKDYTVKAIAGDSEITVTDAVMFSTSAVDTTGFLLQVGSFWKHLEWPIASVAYGLAVSVMQKVSECALFYVGEVFKRLNREDMFNEKGRFRATEKVPYLGRISPSPTTPTSLSLSPSPSPSPPPPLIPPNMLLHFTLTSHYHTLCSSALF